MALVLSGSIKTTPTLSPTAARVVDGPDAGTIWWHSSNSMLMTLRRAGQSAEALGGIRNQQISSSRNVGRIAGQLTDFIRPLARLRAEKTALERRRRGIHDGEMQ